MVNTGERGVVLSVIVLLLVGVAGQPLSAQDVLVSTGSEWRYLDDGSDQGDAWHQPDFDDSDWASGYAEFGYGDGDEATVVSYGPDSSNKYVTTYFRHTFSVSDPSVYPELILRILRDDGAVVYLNGVEVFRTNMPSGPVTNMTFASSPVGGSSEDDFIETNIDSTNLVKGDNLLAVEIHQSDSSSSDISFDLSLSTSSASEPQEQMLVVAGSEWKYLDDGSDQEDAWYQPDFDDSGWASGPAELGYGDGDEATIVSYGPDSNNKYITTYFRHTFNISDPSIYPELSLRILRDDGAVVYLNGVEVFRTNMPNGPVNNMTFASGAVGGSSEDDFIETNIDSTNLVKGDNLLAVEIHQSDLRSSDISFDLTLSSATGQPGPVTPPAGSNGPKGPYLIYPGDNTQMQVLWQLQNPESHTIRWGRDTTYSDGSAAPIMYGDNQYSHTITGLIPGLKYYYIVENLGSGSFFAALPDDAADVKFLAFGDTQSDTGTQDIVNGAMIDTYTVDPGYQTFTLKTGDWTNTGDNESAWTNEFFSRSYPNIMEMMANLPINGCMGNHDGSGELYEKYWPYPYQSGGYYWSFDYGPVHIVVLELYSERNGLGEAQRAWLEADLAASDKEWKFLQFHAPVYSAGGLHPNNTVEQAFIQSLCEIYGVSIVFTGHNHYYAHCDVNGVKHITTGGGGASLRSFDLSHDPSIVTAISEYHFCKIDIQGLQLDFEAVKPDGEVIDSFTLYHVDDTTAPVPNPAAWAMPPYPTRYDSISMTASVAEDDYHPVQYYFECAGGAGHDSGWQSSETYVDIGLEPSTTYSYRVKTRDLSSKRNETDWSSIESATTDPPDVTAPSPDPMTWAMVPVASGPDSIIMSAAVGSDYSGVEYFFECTSGDGHDSGWQDSEVYEDTGLSENTDYSYRVKARDKSPNQNEGGWSEEMSARTYINFPYPGDLNNDGLVNFEDMALMTEQWGRCDCSPENFWCEFADQDMSGCVDPCDLSILVSNWHEEPLAEEVMMAFDDFESYENGTRVARLPDWYCLSFSSRSVSHGIGIGGSAGVTSSTSAFIWSGGDGSINAIHWPELLKDEAVVISMDFEFSGASFKNDIVGWWNSPSYGSSGGPGAPGASGQQAGHFGVLLDRVAGSQSGFGITGYWNNAAGNAARPLIANIDSLDSGEWYRLHCVFTKLSDFSTQIDVELWRLNDNGERVSMAAEGSIEDTNLLDQDIPGAEYFTTVWPAFMNDGAPGACDNAYCGLIVTGL